MTSPSADAFASKPTDRNAVAIFVAIVWVGIVSGFGTDSYDHIKHSGLDYPLIVHIHAVVFVAWLALFTAQILLVRASRVDLHKRLGVMGAGLAFVMCILGPATALTVDARAFAASGKPPVFAAVQFSTMIGFAGLTAAALLLRGTPAAHKRLMLLGLVFLSTAGFARFLNGLVAEHIELSFAPRLLQIYFFTDVLILAAGVYDLIVRRRLHPAYMVGAVWCIAWQAIALTLLPSPAWRAFSLHLIGH